MAFCVCTRVRICAYARARVCVLAAVLIKLSVQNTSRFPVQPCFPFFVDSWAMIDMFWHRNPKQRKCTYWRFHLTWAISGVKIKKVLLSRLNICFADNTDTLWGNAIKYNWRWNDDHSKQKKETVMSCRKVLGKQATLARMTCALFLQMSPKHDLVKSSGAYVIPS